MRFAIAVLQRLGGLLLVFLGVTFVIYFFVFALPGDPIAALGGDRPLDPATTQLLREKYHLDDPFLSQYLRWLGNLLQGDFGIDFTGRPVAPQMAARWPVTITLALSAWSLEILIGLTLGLIAAIRRGTLIDKGILATTILLSSVPVFVLGTTAQLVFGVRLHVLPVAGTAAGWPVSYLLPALVIAVFGLAATSRLMRTSALDALSSDYIRLTRAKGLSESTIIGVHVLRNSAIPAATFLGTDLGYLLGGTVIVEGIFNLPGVGNLLFGAIRSHEGATIVAISTALIIIFLISSVLIDLLHAALDPRIRRD